MKRRVIQLGGSTLVISLPSKWAKEHRLAQGQELDVESDEQGRLIVGSGELKEHPESSIRLKGLTESSIRTLITNSYRTGYDRITVHFETKAQLAILKQVVKTRLIGFEIVRHAEASCVVENVTEPSPDQFENIVRKLLFNIDELIALTGARLRGETASFDYEEIEENIQKYDNFCRRVIMKERKPRSELLWTFLALVLHAQRELYHLNKLLDKRPRARKHAELLAYVHEAFALLQRAYIEKDLEPLSELHDLHARVYYKSGYDALRGAGDNALIAHHLLASLKQFYLANSPLAGVLV